MVKVKVCGITRAEDAALASQLGATALGFVFWEGSARWISTKKAREIVNVLPREVVTVGVFVDPELSLVEDIVNEVGLKAVQMHGSESAEFCVETARRFDVDVLKAVSLSGKESIRQTIELPQSITVLVDAHDPVNKGGTGRQVDWSLAAEVTRERPAYLAGGLSVKNVVDAISVVRPYGIDLSSGLETEPGVKSGELLREFFSVVASAKMDIQDLGDPLLERKGLWGE